MPSSDPWPAADYAALFGFYLGDGCLSTYRNKVAFRVACDQTYPNIISDVTALMGSFAIGRSVFHVSAPGTTVVQTGWKHWLCLFHSDGCRVENSVRRMAQGEEKVYRYPRWQFSNRSEDIHALCGAALDRLGIAAWRRSGQFHLSVSRCEAVAELDNAIGPKS